MTYSEEDWGYISSAQNDDSDGIESMFDEFGEVPIRKVQPTANRTVPLAAAEHADQKGLTWCKYCHTGGLHWYKTKTAGWRLFDKEGRIHSCKGKQ